jgi:hypothetical protein
MGTGASSRMRGEDNVVNKLIVHIEYEDDNLNLPDRMEGLLGGMDGIGIRFFASLEEAQAWERGDPQPRPIDPDTLIQALWREGCINPWHHVARLRTLAVGARVDLTYHQNCPVLVGERIHVRNDQGQCLYCMESAPHPRGPRSARERFA